jgi:ubiquinone/menaquinone biosynthesis C-methylase UbiE
MRTSRRITANANTRRSWDAHVVRRIAGPVAGYAFAPLVLLSCASGDAARPKGVPQNNASAAHSGSLAHSGSAAHVEGAGHVHNNTAPLGKAAHRHDFADAERWAREFEAPERATWQNPEQVVAALQLFEGAVVVDLGAGTGYFLQLLSAAVGNAGWVLALDTEAEMVYYMRRRVLRNNWQNVGVEVIAADEPGLVENSVDRILIVNTWHHIANHAQYLRKLYRALRPKGEILIVDFTETSPIGPPVHERQSAASLLAELVTGGMFDAEQIKTDLPYQYVIRAKALSPGFPYGYQMR